MKLFNFNYSSFEDLELFVTKNKIGNSPRTFLQIFCGNTDRDHIEAVIKDINSILPDINIIGSTSFSEIANGKILKHSTLLSFTVFENTDVRTYYIEDASKESGYDTAEKILTDKSKCLIIFSESLQTNCVPFINGIQKYDSGILVTGGNAADDYAFKQTLVIQKDKVYDKGIVVAVLDSDVLTLHNDYALNWNPFGKHFIVTKAEGNIVKELDNKPIIEAIRYYFGQTAVDNLPASIIEFPLVKLIENTSVARAPVAVTEDGIIYAGDFNIGDVVRFGVGDIEDMHANAVETAKKLSHKPVEAIYIYSCTGRHTFLGKTQDIEIEMLEKVAPIAGFFTYGELYHTGNTNQILNLTTTILTLSESSQLPNSSKLISENASSKGAMLRYLTNFINTVTQELEENLNSLQSYKKFLDESTIVSKTDIKGNITYVNEAFCKISEYTPEEVLGKPHSIVKHPDTPREVHQIMWNTIKAKKQWKGILKNLSKSGKTNYLDTIVMPIMDKEGEIQEFMSVRHDMTKIIRQEQLINEQLTDNLTKLPNRVKLFEDLENDNIEFLALLNIDGFKGINDLYGFDIADQLLIEVSSFIKAKMSYNTTLYRIGGDVFAITCKKTLRELFREKIINLVTDINKNIFVCGEYNVDVNMTAGLAYNTDRLLTSAEVALRNAKKNGLVLDSITKDSPEANTYLENTRWLRTVKEALSTGNIINHYQIIQSISNPKDVKYEALVRLRDNEGKIHSPFAFLPVIKQTTEYEHITKTVLFNVYEACAKYKHHFSLNLSAQDIKNHSTILYMKQLFSMSNIANRITLEITESEAIVDYSHMINFINEFKEMGCRIAIDDFGSGYSNFAYLAQFNVDFLKIDGSIVKRVLQDRNALITMESILDFAKRLGVKTIAEFVSDQAIYDKMQELGVDYVQGYHIGKPEPLD